MVIDQKNSNSTDFSERDLLYKVLFDMKQDINEMKQIIVKLMKDENTLSSYEKSAIITRLNKEVDGDVSMNKPSVENAGYSTNKLDDTYQEPIQENVEIEESLSLEEREKELIFKALEKHNGRRKNAALELGISERTLYRKIKEYDISK